MERFADAMSIYPSVGFLLVLFFLFFFYSMSVFKVALITSCEPPLVAKPSRTPDEQGTGHVFF